jgi:hypothetical protein
MNLYESTLESSIAFGGLSVSPEECELGLEHLESCHRLFLQQRARSDIADLLTGL